MQCDSHGRLLCVYCGKSMRLVAQRHGIGTVSVTFTCAECGVDASFTSPPPSREEQPAA